MSPRANRPAAYDVALREPFGVGLVLDPAAGQGLLGHLNVSTTMIHTPVPNRGPAGVRRPAGRMFL